jgi:hypothetical protein
LDILSGFKEHLKITTADARPEMKAIKEESVQLFERALCNEGIAKHILGDNFFKGAGCERS